MRFKVQFYILLLTTVLSCEVNEERSFQHKLENYDSADDYVISTRKNFENFLDDYYDDFKKKVPSLRKKDDLIKNFIEVGDKAKWYISWVKKQLSRYNNRFPIQTTRNIFNFHLYRSEVVNSKGTIIYVHDNLTSPSLGWEFLVEYSLYFKDYNFISVDLTKVSRNEKSFTVVELNDVFGKELNSFFKDQNLEKDKVIVNVTCRSFAFTYKFLTENSDFYKKSIFYTPMVVKSKSDKLVLMSEVYQEDKKVINYHEMSNFYQLPRGNNQNAKVVPKSDQYINLITEFNLSKSFKKGFTLDGIHDRYLIYPEYEDLLSFDTMKVNSFEKDKIFMLKGMYHNDYYTNKDKWISYFKVIESILEE